MSFDLSQAVIVDHGRSKCFDCAREIRSCEWLLANKAVPGSHICIKEVNSIYTKQSGYTEPHSVYCVTSCPKYISPLPQHNSNKEYEKRQRKRGNVALRCYMERKDKKYLSPMEKTDQKAVEQVLKEIQGGKSSDAKLQFIKEYFFTEDPPGLRTVAKTVGSTYNTVGCWNAEISFLVGYYANTFDQEAQKEGRL